MARPLACLLVACVALSTGVVFAGQGPASPRTLSRVDRLEAWLTAVEQHRSGTADGWVIGVREWDRFELQLVLEDVLTIVMMIREPRIKLYYAPQPRATLAGRGRRILYTGGELERLQAAARGVVDRGGEDRLLIRGAMLHADVEMLTPARGGRPRTFGRDGPSQTVQYFEDGQTAGSDDSASHFEMGRRLLDFLWPQGQARGRPNPASESTALAWYVAIASYQQAIGVLDFVHRTRSLQLFPRDADVLFLAGCLQEMASGPQVQTMLRSGGVVKAVASGAQSEGATLREAERLFRQSLERDPLQVEARIRLGRVIDRRGRHEEAARELRQALAATENALLQYYGNLFLGAAVEALGRTSEAREAYERASAGYPRAQAPRMALSAMAARRGDRSEALGAVKPVLRRESVEREDDPWWSYYTAQGRATIALLSELRVRIAQAERK